MNRGKKERLGRGLEALLGDFMEEGVPPDAGEVKLLPVGEIRPNPFQPRQEFSPEDLGELAKSIDANGLLQPLLVRPRPGEGAEWELVAGERRLRAVVQLGWSEVPAWIRDVDDQTLLVLALVENLQRESLGALEEAEGYRVLSESFGLTQGEIAEAVGKNRSTVANTLRLLNLPPSVRRLLTSGVLSAGHVRPLVALEDPIRAGDIAKKAAREGWSVRQVEEEAKAKRPKKNKASSTASPPGDPLFLALQEELRRVLGTRVKLRKGRKGKGVIEVPFLGPEDFERIFALLAGREASEVLE
ncbi:MAG: ParB/RepB/Spo0J family partition protein [Gemmatimonadetes bacterium]|nr:ParB/RepB/Spo0J family partition protein [Gemmatimonadota bacterium]